MSGLPASGLRGEAQTLLHSLAWNAERRAIRRVVRRGHDVDVTDDAGETPLHGAAAWGHCTTVRELLALGADPNIASTDGAAMTPLHWAASHGNLGVVRALFARVAMSTGATRAGARPRCERRNTATRPSRGGWTRVKTKIRFL